MPLNMTLIDWVVCAKAEMAKEQNNMSDKKPFVVFDCILKILFDCFNAEIMPNVFVTEIID